ncbi:MAG TPA: DUF2752 domain-containing protein [Coleofasciculaceae cyanobacterium]
MFSRSPHVLSRCSQRLRVFQLGLLSMPLLGAWYYSRTNLASPFRCPLRDLTGIPCPTCGMTHAFIAMAQGDMPQAIAHHALAPVLLVGMGVAIVHIGLELWTKRHIHTFYSRFLGHRGVQVAALLVLLGYHTYRLSLLAQSGELAAAVRRSPLGHMGF